jgi:hypothetical protein
MCAAGPAVRLQGQGLRWARGQKGRERNGGRDGICDADEIARLRTQHRAPHRPRPHTPPSARACEPIHPVASAPRPRGPPLCQWIFSLPIPHVNPFALEPITRARAPGQDGGRTPLEGLLRPHQVHRRGQEQAGERAARRARERGRTCRSHPTRTCRIPPCCARLAAPRSALAARTPAGRTDHVGISAEVAALGRRARSPPTAPHPTISSPQNTFALSRRRRTASSRTRSST